jgi:hypothetical protein
VAITAGDAAAPIVDAEFGSLIATDLAAGINGGLLGVVVAAGAIAAAASNIPTSIGVWHDMMGFRSFSWHRISRALRIRSVYRTTRAHESSTILSGISN